MLPTPAYGATAARQPLAPFSIERREPGPHEVLIEIAYCGVCHTDLHFVRDDWGMSQFPMVPGHEIVGHVSRVGSEVKKYKVGDAVGVGCFVDSCRTCPQCQAKQEQFCEKWPIMTYNGVDPATGKVTYGGYSKRITVDENYVLSVPAGLPLDRAAPLLCAGITTYSPMRHFGVKSGDRVAVVGLGGLGHMAVKIAAAMGAHVTVLSTSPSKRADALALGAHDFAATGDGAVFQERAGQFHFVFDTVSAPHDYNAYLNLLGVDGTMVLLGVPEAPAPVAAMSLIPKRRVLTGSFIGGIAETQEMLDFCAAHGIAADIELIRVQDIDAAYERMLKGDVRYRFVIDIASLGEG
jgi:uncharacterized zinc-type alcohol dehydrogenase-like protein